MKKIVLSFTMTLLFGMLASAATQIDTNKDFSTLGDNDAVVQKANSVTTKNKYKAVQQREVDLNSRLEFGASYGPTFGGEPYIFTQNLGANLDYHIIPQLSIGAHYYHAFNQLTSTGQDAFSSAQAAAAAGNTNYRIPAIDYPQDSYMGIANWYFTYGKINFLNLKTIQFDLYALAGGGEISMSSGMTGTYTGGAGIGFWATQNLTVRIEGRYQTYNETTYEGTQRLDLLALTFGLGVLL